MLKKWLPGMLLLLCTVAYAQQEKKKTLQDLLKELPAAKEDTNKIKLLGEIGLKYRRTDLDQSIRYLHQAIDLATKLGDRNAVSEMNFTLGNVYSIIPTPDSALKHYAISLAIEKEKGDIEAQGALLINMGGMYQSKSDYPLSREKMFAALRLFEQNGNWNGQANCFTNIANTYLLNEDYDNTLVNCEKALKIYRDHDQKAGVALVEGNIGDVYLSKKDFDRAEKYFVQSLNLYRQLEDSSGIERNLSNMATLYNYRGQYQTALKYVTEALNISETVGIEDGVGYNYQVMGEIYFAIATDSTGNTTAPSGLTKAGALQKAGDYTDSAITVLAALGDLDALSKAYEHKSKIEQRRGDFKSAYAALREFKTLSDSVFNIEKDKKLTQTAMQYEFDKKEAAAKSEQEKKDARQRVVRNSIAAGLAGALIFLLVVYRQRNKIARERKRSDELLLNILPGEVAQELKEKGSSEARLIDEVTVLFTDFKGFTQLSEKLSAQQLVKEINICFSAFDNIMQQYGVEKIKTIGDSYMAAGGLPVPNKTHAVDVVKAALEIQKFMHEYKEKKMAAGELFFDIRIGVHTGHVVAGIVGVKKFQYDIWGDTVNTASRMESSGEPGKVNISETTFEKVKDVFHCVHRGKITAKGKGDIDMYFVEKV